MKFLSDHIDLLHYMVISSARNESRQLYGGLAWWIIEPACYMAVMYAVFGLIMQRGGPGFIGFLLIGFIFWRWNDGTVKKVAYSLVGAKAILTQTRIPAWLFPLSEALTMLIRFLPILVMLTVFAYFYTGQMGTAYLVLPLVLLANLMFVFSLGWILSLVVPFFPDGRKIIDSGFQLLFFSSGIFYNINQLEPAIAKILYMNPIAGFLNMYRGIMLDNILPSLDALYAPALFTVALVAIACIAQVLLGPRLPKVLMQ